MSDPRYSREDYARQTRRLTFFVDEADEEGSETVQVHKNVLRLAAAMLSEAANRAHDAELGALIRASFSAGAWRILSRELRERNGCVTRPLSKRLSRIADLLHTPEPGAPQHDGPSTQPSAPAEDPC